MLRKTCASALALTLFVLPTAVLAQNNNVLEDGTPVRLRINKTLSSAEAQVDERVDFEVLEDIKVGQLTVIKQGSTAWGTVTEAKPKGRMGKGGKLNVNIDGVKLVDGTKIPLRGVKNTEGGGHTGAMTGAMVGTAIVFWPAAPLFLFMKGKDVVVPKGHEFAVYVNGDRQIDTARIMQASATGSTPQAMAVPATMGGASAFAVSSNPPGAEIEIDGNFVASTPSTVNVGSGDHTISVKKAGYRTWTRKVHATGGNLNIQADLIRSKSAE